MFCVSDASFHMMFDLIEDLSSERESRLWKEFQSNWKDSQEGPPPPKKKHFNFGMLYANATANPVEKNPEGL